ncbi:MAG: hypothetical protein IT308_03850 [Anaerolineaceae bacterium]|nr:hypothetical protein [Anaerolineaceae bacterium]
MQKKQPGKGNENIRVDRQRRRQPIIFSILAVIIILSWIISLIVVV